jgi:alpha-1,3-fucosyltransferase 10
MAPLILFRTNFFGSAPSLAGISPELQKDFTLDHSRLREADAVVFHIPEWSWSLADTCKFPGQLWVAWSMESNVHYEKLRDPNFMRHFDLRATYERDADVWIPYLPQRSIWNSIQNSQVPAKTESHPTVLFQSTKIDKSGRNAFIAELMRYTKIDSYGRFLRNRYVNGVDQWRPTKLAVIGRYHFCLAFENSIAPDYVTEKLFDPLRAGTIPVYRGAPNFQEFVPEGSFINADLFDGPKDLANYLHYLVQNPKQYENYFEWRQRPLPDSLSQALTRIDSEALLRLQSAVTERLRNRQRRRYALPSYPFGLSAAITARARRLQRN